jgi:cobalt-zinc-cadmium efflux system protein
MSHPHSNSHSHTHSHKEMTAGVHQSKNHSHHGHSHSASHFTQPEQLNTAFGLAIFLNLTFVIVEAILAWSANSMGLLADAGHNLGDVLGLIMAGGANWLLTRDSSAKYSYGFRKTTILAALANGLIMLAGAGIIAFESVNKIFHPTSINAVIVMVVALIGIFINGGTALLFMKGQKDDLNIKSAFLHLAWDAVISFSVVIVGAIIWYTHWLWLDPIVGLALVVAMILSTWGLMRDSTNLILDAVPHHVDQKEVEAYLRSLTGVEFVHDLHIWGLSTRESALTAHLVMPNHRLSDHDFQKINEDMKFNFNIQHITLQVESGVLEDPCGQVKTC